MAHITGGGLAENLPRVLPPGLEGRVDRSSWDVPPVFGVIQERGAVATDEMERVFNMGVGMVLVCAPDRAVDVRNALPEAWALGEVVRSVTPS